MISVATASLTKAEVCAQLRVSRMTLARLVSAGRLTPVYLSQRSVRYYQDEVDRLLGADDGTETTIREALALLAEQHAEDERPMCNGCAKRRAPKSGALCQICTEQAEVDKAYKRDWWNRNKPQRTTINGQRVYVKPAGRGKDAPEATDDQETA